MSACTHGGLAANLAVGTPCVYGDHIVTVTLSVASQVTSGEVGVATQGADAHLPATIVPGVAANREARSVASGPGGLPPCPPDVPAATPVTAPGTFIAASLFDVAPDVVGELDVTRVETQTCAIASNTGAPVPRTS